jgi:hypothetical protein
MSDESPTTSNSSRPLPRLRGHHFICLQFYGGEGYSPAFVENLVSVVERVGASAAVLVEGADDVCAACPNVAPDGTCVDPDTGEEQIRQIDALAREVLEVEVGARLSLEDARELLAAHAIGAGRWRFEACVGCQWEDICDAGWDALLGEEGG